MTVTNWICSVGNCLVPLVHWAIVNKKLKKKKKKRALRIFNLCVTVCKYVSCDSPSTNHVLVQTSCFVWLPVSVCLSTCTCKSQRFGHINTESRIWPKFYMICMCNDSEVTKWTSQCRESNASVSKMLHPNHTHQFISSEPLIDGWIASKCVPHFGSKS